MEEKEATAEEQRCEWRQTRKQQSKDWSGNK